MAKGLLITFEGTEGAGKSTLIKKTGLALKALGYPILVTREPGGTPVAEKIRKLILKESMNPWTELFLYQASRAEHVHEKILPAIAKGQILLCDRFYDSTLAYQSYARGLSWKKTKELCLLATHGLKPHLTILLDIDPRVGLSRAKDANRFEAEGVAFQNKVRRGYLKALREDPKRWLKLDTSKGSSEQLTQQILSALRKRKLLGLTYGKKRKK